MATLRLFSRLVQQSPDAFAQLKARFYQIYVKAQKQRPQAMKPHVKAPVPQDEASISLGRKSVVDGPRADKQIAGLTE